MPTRRATGLVALTMAVVAGVAGCGGSAEPLRGAGPLVQYGRSGGLAYSRVDVIVLGGGSTTVTATGPTGERKSSVILDRARLARLRRLMAAAPLSSLPERRQLGCADCYQYHLVYGGDTYATDEASVPPSLRPVIAALESIVSRAGTATPAGK